MLKRIIIIIAVLVMLLLLGTTIIHAQGNSECAIDNSEILQQVNEVCADVGTNEICYGNDQVTVVTNAGEEDSTFNRPGARASLLDIRSLFLSEVNITANTWGVAQLQLQVNQGNGTQDITMLLFGNVAIENQIEPTEGIEIVVMSDTAPMYPIAPSGGFDPMTTIFKDTTVKAIARLANNLWIRIELLDTGAIGWVLRTVLDLTPEDAETLPIEIGTAPHFGIMQAFSFESGTSPDCGSTVADGLLIQTPQGVARVSFLINEVAIELTSASNGASAFVQANPEGGVMEVSVLDGTAYVGEGTGIQQVDAGSQTSIPITVNLLPTGSPSRPESFNSDEILSIPVLPVIRSSSQDFVPEDSPSTSRSVAINTGDENLVVPSNNTSVDISSNGNPSGTGDSSTSQNGGETSSSGGDNDIGSNGTGSNSDDGSDIALPNLGGDSQSDDMSDTPSPNEEEEDTRSFILNIIGVVVVILGGFGLIAWLIYTSRRHR